MIEVINRGCELARRIDITALHTAFVKTMQKGEGSSGEFHNFWEMVVVIEGTLMAATGKGVFKVKQNCMMIHPPMAFHRHFNEEDLPVKFLVMSFDAGKVPVEKDCVYVLDGENVKECLRILDLIREKYILDRIYVERAKVPDDLSGQAVKSELELYLANTLSGVSFPRKNINPEYQRIVKYIKENLRKNLNQAQIAGDLNMSVANLKKIFSRYSDMGIMTYYNRCRIEQAVRLLEQGYLVKEVAEMLEYSSQSAFCTAFKNTLGFAPSKVRKR